MFLTAYVHDNNIGSDFFDIFIWDDKFGFAVKQREKFIITGNDNFAYLSGTFIKFKVADFAKTFAVFEINN